MALAIECNTLLFSESYQKKSQITTINNQVRSGQNHEKKKRFTAGCLWGITTSHISTYRNITQPRMQLRKRPNMSRQSSLFASHKFLNVTAAGKLSAGSGSAETTYESTVNNRFGFGSPVDESVDEADECPCPLCLRSRTKTNTHLNK